MFPYRIRFKKTLNCKLTPEQISIFLAYAEQELQERKVNNLTKQKLGFTFKNELFSWMGNWRLMAYVDSGSVMLEEVDNASVRIIYQISVIRNFLIGAGIVGIIFGRGVVPLNFLIVFVGLVVAFWVFNMLRHYIFLSEMVLRLKGIINEEL